MKLMLIIVIMEVIKNDIIEERNDNQNNSENIIYDEFEKK